MELVLLQILVIVFQRCMVTIVNVLPHVITLSLMNHQCVQHMVNVLKTKLVYVRMAITLEFIAMFGNVTEQIIQMIRSVQIDVVIVLM